jgi:hypothetical protein
MLVFPGVPTTSPPGADPRETHDHAPNRHTRRTKTKLSSCGEGTLPFPIAPTAPTVCYLARPHVVPDCTASRIAFFSQTTNFPSSPILVTLMKEALSSSETSVHTRATRRNIPEDYILHSLPRENPKCYIALTGWTL